MADQTDILSLLDPSGQLAQQAEGRARSQGLLNLGFALLQASQGQPGQGKPGLGQVIGQAGPVGLQAYQQSFDQTLGNLLKGLQVRSMVSEMSAPKYERLKLPSGGEIFVQFPRGGGTPTPVQIPGLDITTKPIEFDAQTQAFIDLKFGKPYNQLSKDEKAVVSDFINAPNDEKLTTLRIEGAKQQFETGQTVPIPRGRGELLRQAIPAQPMAAPQMAAPQAQPTPTEQVQVSEIAPQRQLPQVPVSLIAKPLGESEVPLIRSAGISPKQKQELELARPATQSSVEYVVNTNRAMRGIISEILASPGLKDAFGMGGETLSKIPGSPAADVRAKLERLGGNLFIEAMTALRNASKNGAGVGNATEREGDKLERSRAALQQFQNPEVAKKELENLLKSLEEAEGNVLNAYERTYGKGTFKFTPLQTPEAKAKRPPLSNIFGGQQ